MRFRSGLLALVFTAILVAPFVLKALRQDERPPARSLGADAVELTIITPHNQDIRRVFAPAFSDWHERRYGAPAVVRYLSPGGTNDILRYLTDLYGSYRDDAGTLAPESEISTGIDLVWGGGDYAFDREFKPFLKPLELDPEVLTAAFPRADLGGVALYDSDAPAGAPRWVGVVLSSFGIVYAPHLYDALSLPAPESWRDLARPELAGLLALADPTRSGSAAVIYMMVLQRAMYDAELAWRRDRDHGDLETPIDAAQAESPEYRAALAEGFRDGMRTLLRMAANARYFTDSGSRPCADVGDGEAAAGVAIDFYARVFQEQIGRERITYVAPAGETAITPDPIGVLYGTLGEREVVANRFVEFLLSKSGQVLWNVVAEQSAYVSRSLRRLPIRRDVYFDREGWADRDDPFRSARGFNMQKRWMRPVGRLRPIWAAAWIDAKLSLDSAYAAVLALPSGTDRERLLFELSNLPVELDDVSGPSPAGSAQSERRLIAARERMRWARLFREHYRAVERHARRLGS